jgi:16S rRNA (uracil1498-N3)-methyltransferase
VRQFYLETDPGQIPAPGQEVALDAEESHHLFTVLRSGREQVLNLTDGRGHRFTARSVGGSRRKATLEILDVHDDVGEFAQPQLVLACAVVKAKRFEWALEKAVEAGAHQVVPLRTEHGVVEPGGGKFQRWQTIMKAALKQSGRTWLPDLAELTELKDFLAQSSGWLAYGAVPGVQEDASSWTRYLNSHQGPVPSRLTVLIGPEGGWSPAEEDHLKKSSAVPLNLGPHVLRTETAAVAGLLALQELRQAWLSAGPASG